MSRAALALLTAFTLSVSVSAKEKQKAPLPFTVLRARTIAVIVDPDAGRRITNPTENQTAQRDVEIALRNWGRFEITTSPLHADIIVVLRKGTRAVEPTLPDPRQNGRIGSVEPIDDGIGIGAQRGSPTSPNQRPIQPYPQSTAPSRAEITSTPDDSFVVYQGASDAPLDAPAIWRYTAPDALRPHSVPAVDAFRKAVAETERAASKNP